MCKEIFFSTVQYGTFFPLKDLPTSLIQQFNVYCYIIENFLE
jgi:hypothetical protein